MKQRKVLWIALIILLAITAAVSGHQIYRIYSEYQSGETSYTDLEQYISFEDPAPSHPGEEKDPVIENGSGEADPSIFPEIDFDSLREINDQIVGWIYCEDTTINYPITQADDNSYYLKHLFNGEYNSSGCIFLDYRNSRDFTDPHSVIYGHHMRNGNMFAALDDFKEQSYYEAHPQFLLMTPQQNFVVEIFAGYVANVKDEAWKVDFGTMDEYETWIRKTIEKSCIQTGIVPAATDRILTLSTCSYEFDNARFVLLGILQGK